MSNDGNGGKTMNEILKEMQGAPAMRMLKEIEALPAFKAMQDFHDSPGMRAMQKVAKEFQISNEQYRKVFDLAMAKWPAAMPQIQPEVLNQLRQSSLFNYLASSATRMLDVSKLVETEGNARAVAMARGEASLADTQADKDEEIIQALQDGASAATLSNAATVRLQTILIYLWIFYQAVAMWPDFREGACDLQERLLATESISEVRRTIQKELCGAPAGQFRGHRYVSGEGVRLREAPGLKARIIDELPRGVVLEMLDSPAGKKSWLHVRLTYGGEDLEGWIMRRYTKPLRR